jgi:hypothetical protein
MIQLPRRSVTRFFIPLIDVLLLLFCIFLLMPLVKGGNEPAADETPAAREERLRKLEEEAERLRRQARETPKELRDELERLRQEKLKTLQEKLAFRVLEIDPSSGRLFYYTPERVEITSQAKASELIAEDRARQANGKAEVYYLILYPRDPSSPYPLREQRERYDRWFADVAHGWDVPGGISGKRAIP